MVQVRLCKQATNQRIRSKIHSSFPPHLSHRVKRGISQRFTLRQNLSWSNQYIVNM
jgi:hypothetical protein